GIRIPDARAFNRRVPPVKTVFALLPYLLDFARPATRRDVIAGRAEVESRTSRKMQGMYLTPGDVAQFMVETVTSTDLLTGRHTWLDPAAGTGVFLRHVQSTYSNAAVFGIDVDPRNAELAPYVMLATENDIGSSPYRRWHAWRLRFATGDALLCVRGDEAGR